MYRGSRDGFTAATFHAQCDNKGATVTIIKATTNYIFGGYSTHPWNSTNALCDKYDS